MSDRVFVFDIDGTLTVGRYTEESLPTVKENPILVLLAKSLQKQGDLVISTARPERYREQTEKWLTKHKLKPVAVYMRPENRDKIADHMVKFEHLEDIRKKFGEPLLWADDNDNNVTMLERNGIPVIHVKPGKEK